VEVGSIEEILKSMAAFSRKIRLTNFTTVAKQLFLLNAANVNPP